MKKILTTLFLLLSVNANAYVSTKNGNFFMMYTDFRYEGGFEPKVDRAYNSKTSYKGFFGYGWGNEYEVRMSPMADGSVVVHEYGGGAENRFVPPAFKPADLEKAVVEMTDAAKKAGWIASGPRIEEYKKRLATDSAYRTQEWEKLLAAQKIKRRVVPENTQLISNAFSYQFITKVKDGYLRSFEGGKVERFDELGRLVKVTDKNNNFMDLKYSKEGRLIEIVDSFRRKIFISYNAQNLVEKVQGENNKVATYKYNKGQELIESKDTEGNVYRYSYATDDTHNMVQIAYSDKTTMDIAYYDAAKLGSVKKVKDRDGTYTEYDYKYNKDRTEIGVSTVIKAKDGKTISQASYNYISRKKPDGQEWTYKLDTVIDGEKTETVYNECCGMPLLIKRGKEETAFVYDLKGRVTKKTTSSEVTELKYDAKVGKISEVAKHSKTSKAASTWSKFTYDTKGNLTFAKNSSGKAAQLIYDSAGRISTMIDQNRKKIQFKYNEFSKPVVITDPSVGTITVEYNNSGEVKNINSTAGRKIALQVTSSFQNLLEIIRPAGVQVSF